MSLTTRMILILVLILPNIVTLIAQEATETTETTATTATTAATTTAAETTDTAATTDTTATTEGGETTTTGDADAASYEVRNMFTRMLQRHPYELATVLVLDPSLLNNQQFVSGYPELGRFLERHPEVKAAPRFYLAEFGHRAGHDDGDRILEPLMAFAGVALATLAVGWFIRTLIEQRRWNKLNRTQTEVHNKILDRFGTTAELLEYVKTPAGTKFLESAPIPLHAQAPTPQKANAPVQRVLWTVQAGVVLVAMGFGLLLISLRYPEGRGEGVFDLGAIALCIGGGFIASAAVSLFLSRRLGLWQSSGDRVDVS